MHEEDAFADRDAFGLTSDDWMCFLGSSPRYYSGPALLWWAVAGISEDHEGPWVMNEDPFVTLLRSVGSDARALATLASSSLDDDLQALAPALHNLHRRIEAAAEIAFRMETDRDGAQGPRADPPEVRALPSPKEPARRRDR